MTGTETIAITGTSAKIDDLLSQAMRDRAELAALRQSLAWANRARTEAESAILKDHLLTFVAGAVAGFIAGYWAGWLA